ncbi:uncharacterized protein LAESUDRAFT_715606 [Laetiporus sulphureus 93-53]|uniref:Uncharacterized protein n=1 Tax=Laetiporus sulphureus 93-53 TaxID=1314785 RepID=A0A165D6U5_9APHY|nr:uncharacterized protein LAESUDRAFT_715606 [Laetiporus sulphureus 93-53]KZT04261.1 hypothetical protein LAESUDRAFT_715606 [Laetiporus sulphureus 93-53]
MLGLEPQLLHSPFDASNSVEKDEAHWIKSTCDIPTINKEGKMYVGLDRTHFLSSSTQCHPYDASGNGYHHDEGVECSSSSDCPMQLIRTITSLVSSNLILQSLSHLHSPMQVQLYKKLFNVTETHLHKIGIIEAHDGTDTQAGNLV